MGAQLHGGEDNELAWSDGCFLVLSWCEPFQEPQPEFRTEAERTRHFMDQAGSFDVSAATVLAADSAIPAAFEHAKAKGLVPDGARHGPLDERDFDECRRFLAEAARQGANLHGSY